jgi:hypothetical protein
LGGLTGIAFAGAASLGLGWTGCAGNAFTLQSGAGSSVSSAATSSIDSSSTGSSVTGSSATGSSASIGPADASTSFCSSYTSYLFCESFDEGVPGHLLEVPQDAGLTGMLLAYPDASVPPSKQSMEVTTPKVNIPGESARTLAGQSFSMTETDLFLEAEFYLGPNCVADGVAVAIVTASSPAVPGVQYSVALTVGVSAVSVVEILVGPDAGSALVPHSTTVGLTSDQWTDVKLTVHLVEKTVDLTVGAVSVTRTALDEAPTFVATGPGINASFAVGAAVTDVDATALACDLLVDNVLFNDVAP